MSKRAFKSSASSGRAVAGFGGFGSSSTTQSSVLSYIQEPLDLQSISDAKIVVIFKNLTKRDETTKAKALDDLQASLGQPGALQDSVLEAWVRLFPRLSIDNSRRVRQLTHNVNGKMCSEAGKRTAKHMPTIAGPWLAGQFDNDSGVARAARDSIALVFSDPAKVAGLRKMYQQAVLGYCKDAILHETASTLSDERVVSHEDAESTYSRVVSSCLTLVMTFIIEFDAAKSAKYRDTYAELLDTKTIEYAVHPNSGIRRATHRLVYTASEKLKELLHERLAQLSEIYVYKGLRSDQANSALDYINTLVVLTQQFPTIWTESYTGKKPPASRLSYFFKQGSQGSHPDFWVQLSELVNCIPSTVLATTSQDASDLLSALRTGLPTKEDTSHVRASWQAYQDLAVRLSASLDADAQKTVLEQGVMPVFRQYLFPTDATAEWAIKGRDPGSIAARLALMPQVGSLLSAELPSFCNQLIELMKSSQPQQAKDYDSSQANVLEAGTRWSKLQLRVFSAQDNHNVLATAFITADVDVITQALQLCSARNGKVYGAAAVVDRLLQDHHKELVRKDEIRQVLVQCVERQLPQLLLTPSSPYLLQCLSILQGHPDFARLFHSTVKSVLALDGPIKQKGQLLDKVSSQKLPPEVLEECIKSTDLQAFILSLCQPQADDEMDVSILNRLLDAGLVAHQTQLACIKQLVKRLHDDHMAVHALEQLDVLAKSHPDVLLTYDTDPIAASDYLVSNALRLSESEDTKTAALATDLLERLTLTTDDESLKARLTTIRLALEDVSQSSPSLDSLFEMTEQLINLDCQAELFLACLPEARSWRDELAIQLTAPPSPLSVSSPLGSAVYLVDQSAGNDNMQYDTEGFSQMLRRALFFIMLVGTPQLQDVMLKCEIKHLRSFGEMLTSSLATIIAARDKVSMAQANNLWREDPVTEKTFLFYADDANETIADALDQLSSKHIDELIATTAVPQGSTTSPLAYYLALTRLTASSMRAKQGSASKKLDMAKIVSQELRTDALTTLAQLELASEAPGERAQVTKLTNELVSSLTGTNFSTSTKEAELKLLALNTILKSDDYHISQVAKQRVIFLVKHLLAELNNIESRIVGEEILRLLAQLLPAMSDIYGEHWGEILDNIITTWSSVAADHQGSDHVPTLYQTLRLYEALRKLRNESGVSEDLLEAFEEKSSAISNGLVQLLEATTGLSDARNQPFEITNVLLARQIGSLEKKPTLDVARVLPMLYASSSSLQQAAFSLLHDQIPQLQEQVSMEAALDNKTARLPDELLSMLLEAPIVGSFDQDALDGGIPPTLQGYLYSWRLLFDYLSSSSYKVKTDYTEHLKEGAYLSKLLEFTFDYLGHARGKPVDVSARNVRTYQPGREPDAIKDVQWLLSHLYYQSLLHLPSLVKSYVLELRTRQTPALIEEWTAKHISPTLIVASLLEVSKWSEKTVHEDPEYEKMTVRVATRSKEVNVSYVVDEQTMAIKIVLPDAYPLAPALVQSVSRVAVKEEKWQSWLRNCQGVITFSNGSIIDGLSAWRRNVTGALKGQTECAICYSIVSGDKQLPTKKCPTCKNLFHSSCLFKWFKTSNASTCPLCRNSFNFN